MSKYAQLNDPEFLRQEYLEREKGTCTIAKELGCSSGAVWHALQRHHILIRKASVRVHALNDIDPDKRTAVCTHCGPVYLHWLKKGRWQCANVSKGYRIRGKKDYCENPRCTATIEHSAQLDIHHVDDDHDNNAPENRRTLCANCHRLEHVRRHS